MAMFLLEGKIALVTGVGSAMGRAMALAFAAQGARVALANRSPGPAEEAAAEIVARGGSAIALGYDGETRAGNLATVEAAVAQFGGLDIVVHNAGTVRRAAITETSEALLDEALAVNLKACFWLLQGAVPHMRARGGGRIAITSSVTGPQVASFGLSAYAASKAAVNGFIRSAALELAADRITVNGIEPGYIAKPGRGITGEPEVAREIAQYIPMKEMGRPDDVVGAMVFLVSDEARYITGQTITVDGGALLPESPAMMTR